jgi:hypothetical protein
MMIGHYSPYCICSHCSMHTFFELGRSAFEPQEFVRRAERHELNEQQRKIVDKVKLQIWNECMKGKAS